MCHYCHLDEAITCFSLLQSKDIGVQMHEELVKVTNELYTVSERNIIALSCLYQSACLPVYPLCSLPLARQSWAQAFFRPEHVTCEAASRTLHPADMPYQRCTLIQVVPSYSWGCERRKFAFFLPLWISPSVWRGERSCPWLSFKRTQQSVLHWCAVLTANTSCSNTFFFFFANVTSVCVLVTVATPSIVVCCTAHNTLTPHVETNVHIWR